MSYTLLIWVARGGGRERPMREAVHRTHSHSAERPPQHKHSSPEAQELGQGGGAPSQAAATFPPFVMPSKHCSISHPTHVALDTKSLFHPTHVALLDIKLSRVGRWERRSSYGCDGRVCYPWYPWYTSVLETVNHAVTHERAQPAQRTKRCGRITPGLTPFCS